MIAANNLELVVVTPEKVVLTKQVRSVQFPLEDGQVGVLPGRAPMVGRLGYGELAYTNEEGQQEFAFVDGGFCQIRGQMLTLLTDRALNASDIELEDAQKQYEEAKALAPKTELERNNKQKAIARSRGMVSFATKHAGATRR